MSTTLLCALPDFQTFLRSCTVYSVHSSNNTDHYSIAHRNLEMYVQPPYVIDGSYADPYIHLNPVTSQCFSLIIYPELHIGNFLLEYHFLLFLRHPSKIQLFICGEFIQLSSRLSTFEILILSNFLLLFFNLPQNHGNSKMCSINFFFSFLVQFVLYK